MASRNKKGLKKRPRTSSSIDVQASGSPKPPESVDAAPPKDNAVADRAQPRNRFALVTIILVGITTFASGLKGQFLGDDQTQIVDNPYIRSLANISKFFGGSTGYNGQTKLVGLYYRPLMTTVFSILYTFFGMNTFGYHMLQLTLHMACGFLIFLIFCYFFNRWLSLVLSLIFLVHPANSQAVFAIASLQEPLFMLFGLMALWLTIKHGARKPSYIVAISLCLFLSLLSKETGLLFVGLVIAYEAITNWGQLRRLYPLLVTSVILTGIYLLLRHNAIGSIANSHLAPIDNLNLAGRLMTAPAIIMFYLTRLVFPVSLAHLYYWVHPNFGIRYVLLPTVIDLAVIAVIVWMAKELRRRFADPRHFVLFTFFAAWFAAGIIITLQIIPLDETVSETWLYFPIVGALGMVGVVLDAFKQYLPTRRFLLLSTIIIAQLAIRTAVRGPNWSNQLTLARHDVAVSKEDFNSYNQIAVSLSQAGQPKPALVDAKHAVAIFPTANDLNTLGVIYKRAGNYPMAYQAFQLGLKQGPTVSIYENLGNMALYYGNPVANKQFITTAIRDFPSDGPLWLDVAIWDQTGNDNADAKIAMSYAARLGIQNPYYYNNIMANKPVNLPPHASLGNGP